MKSPSPPESKSPAPEEPETQPTTKPQAQNESEKDSGYSDSSSESLSSEETTGAGPARERVSPEEAGPARQGASTQPAITPIYILQSVVLRQPRMLLLQPPLRRHRKRPTSYLPILRSYPRIAPRRVPPPAPSPSQAPPTQSPAAPPLLEVSLRAFSLLRRSRETQRSIRELRAHVQLYDRALRGEPGGWELLQRAMERSRGYRRTSPHSTAGESKAEPHAMTSSEPTMTSLERTMTSETDIADRTNDSIA